LGYTALTATCGVDGLNLLSSHAVDILVLDYNMLGMNGETVARKARQAYPELPIILFSGCSQEECSPVLSLVDQYVPKGTLTSLRHTIATQLAPEQQNPSTCYKTEGRQTKTTYSSAPVPGWPRSWVHT
jgi:CheY-like chemotaxis protein